MKRSLFLLCILVILTATSCSEREFKNPAEPHLIMENLKAPVNLQIDFADENLLQLSWEDVCTVETNFEIYKKKNSESYTLHKTLPANSTQWQDNNVSLSYGNSYSYKIYAVNEEYRSKDAAESSFLFKLIPPSNFKMEALSDTRFKLSWEDNNHFEQGYKLDRKVGNSDWQENFVTLSANANSWEYIIDEPDSPGNIWRIRAYYKSQHSDYSSEAFLKVSDPVLSVADGTYSNNQSVTISCATSASTIRYTTNGSTPTSSSTLYNGAISISENTTLKAKAFKNGWIDSSTASASYSFQVATPTFSPTGGTYNNNQSVTINCATNGAVIRYTTNGNTPTSSSALYGGAILINENTKLKAKAFKNGWTDSEIAISNYVIVPEGMVYVPGGTFTMGDTRYQEPFDQIPTHSVTLNSFYIGKYQVTQSEYQAIMGSNPASGYGVGSNYPVYRVSRYDAIKYCNLRSMNEGLTPVYSISGSTNPANWGSVPSESNATWNAAVCNWNANGYRLPTEAEWEYAARGATNSPDYLYSGSDTIGNVAWYYSNSGDGTHPVGGKSANGLGTYDMSGNVYEWCWDWYSSSYYSSSPSNNPRGPASGSERVLRGGCWSNYERFCRVAYRRSNTPSVRSNYIGFRVCRAIN